MLRQAVSSSRAIARSIVPKTGSLGQVRFGSGGSHYNEPSGHLFGEKPLPKGQKRVKEDWENIWYFGMYGGLALWAVLGYYKPDTRIQTWAREEALKKLEASGEDWKYKPSPYSGYSKSE